VSVVSGGALAGIAALLGIWPFGGTQALVASIIHRESPAPLTAQSLFPPVQPIHQVIDVYDPAPPASRPGPPAVATAAAPAPAKPPAGQPVRTASYPVVVFPAGPMSAIESTCEAAKQAAQNQSAAYQQNVEQQCEAAKQAYERAHP
jgi:hypothetical protein